MNRTALKTILTSNGRRLFAVFLRADGFDFGFETGFFAGAFLALGLGPEA